MARYWPGVLAKNKGCFCVPRLRQQQIANRRAPHVAYNNDSHIRRAFREVQAFEAEGDYRPAARMTVKQLLKTALEGELNATVAARYAGRRRGGIIFAARMSVGCSPKSATCSCACLGVERGVGFQTLTAHARRSVVLDQLILTCFVLCMSARKMAKAAGAFLVTPLSAQTISRIAAQLDAAVTAHPSMSFLHIPPHRMTRPWRYTGSW